MTELIPLAALMDPVVYEGRDYFTSQYFHRQYLANSAATKKKYGWHQDFIRLMKSIEAYDEHVAGGHIQEIRWVPKRREGGVHPAYLQQIKRLENLFRLIGFQTLYLLDGAAQVAMSHHLDDEISKQMSVAANTMVARQMTRKGHGLLPNEVATRHLASWLEAGKLLGTPLHIAQQEAVKAVEAETGVNFRPLLAAAPAQDNIPEDARMLEPRDLAKELGVRTAVLLNQQLAAAGWQLRHGDRWDPTPTGKPYCTSHAWVSQGKSGYNLKWKVSAVQELLTQQQRNDA